jgi:hypothetical protein
MTAHAQTSVRVRTLAATAGSLVLLLGLAGCTSGSSSAAAKAPDTGLTAAAAVTSVAAAPGRASAGAPAAAVGAAAATTGAAPAAAQPSSAGGSTGTLEGRPAFDANLPAGRSVIYTSTVNVEVATAADVARQADAAAEAARAANGYVFSRNQAAAQNTPAPVPSGQPSPPADIATADLVIKVPPASYGELLVSLDRLGTLLDVNEASQDVTNQMVDTQARLTSYRESVARVRALLTKATTIGQIVEVEGELTRREADLESMEGQLAVLKSQTSYATITLHLQQKAPKVTVVVPPRPKPKKPIHGFVSGLRAGGRGFATVAVAIATVLGATLPFLGLLVGVALVAWFTRRYWRRSHREVRTEQAAL